MRNRILPRSIYNSGYNSGNTFGKVGDADDSSAQIVRSWRNSAGELLAVHREEILSSNFRTVSRFQPASPVIVEIFGGLKAALQTAGTLIKCIELKFYVD